MQRKPYQFQPKIDGRETHSANVSVRLTQERKDKLYKVKDWKSKLRAYIDSLTDEPAIE